MPDVIFRRRAGLSRVHDRDRRAHAGLHGRAAAAARPKGKGARSDPADNPRGRHRPARLVQRRPPARPYVARRRRARGRGRVVRAWAPPDSAIQRPSSSSISSKPLVMGSLRRRSARVWESMYRATLNIGRRASCSTPSAPSTSRLGPVREAARVPVYELLGGKLRASLPAYASWLYATEDLDALAAEAAGWAAQGLAIRRPRICPLLVRFRLASNPSPRVVIRTS